VTAVRKILAELRQSGEYDAIVAEATATPR
jgi:hypothetical protein